ncbi:MAG: hypothetical protein V4611_02270 [Patescibacteria group bacterium]
MPILESNDGLPEPERQVKSREGIQLSWRQDQDGEHHFAHLALTLSRQTLALTVTASYKDSHVSTLVIERGNHSLYETNRNSMPKGYYRGDEAILKFDPELSASLAALRGEDTPQSSQEEQLAS